ncbi:MAG: hypothetical protein HYT73_04440, partial [Candidatus Aenigmarchaeota archaeon]|nr:hypothetical protein [Candidatus Aenigmarchaeota archaeon]
MKDLGIEVGLHGEIGETAGFESAIRKTWEQVHFRLVTTIKNAAELGFIYVNYHLSTNLQVQQEEERLRPFGHTYQIVSPGGIPLADFISSMKETKQFAIEHLIAKGYSVDENLMDEYQKKAMDTALKEGQKDFDEFKNGEEYKRRKEEIEAAVRDGGITKEEGDRRFREWEEGIRQRMISDKVNEVIRKLRSGELPSGDTLFEMWKKSDFGKYYVNFGEIGAYWAVAQYMMETNDPLWTNVLKSKSVQDAYNNEVKGFNEAVAMKYIEGHLTLKEHQFNKKFLDGMSVLEFAKEKNIKILFENPEAGQGKEGLYRLYDVRSAYHLMRKINSPALRFCIDFEHMMAQNMNPYEVIRDVPKDFGKYIFLFHLGEPKPYFGTAHIPIPLGSQAQEVLYKWIYELRRKGFESGYMIFERGGGRAGSSRSSFEVFEHSVWVLRQIAKYLEIGTEPQELPPEFFGISEQNK